MSREIPEVVRAAAGLAATVLDEVRKLPETLPGLPVRIIGLAMQHAMRVQQQYAGLVARGDELFTGIRGVNEPGMATFDDDVDAEPVTPAGFRDSAFDRAADTSASDPSTYADVLADDQDDAAAVAAVVELPDRDGAAPTREEPAARAPTTDEILDEIAIDELVDQAPTLDETAPTTAADALGTLDTLDTEPTVDVATTVDVLTPDGGVATVDATVTDEGIAAPETPATGTPTAETPAAPETPAAAETPAPETPTAVETPAPTDSAAPTPAGEARTGVGPAPVDGYDSFSVAQLRGRLRGYALSTVQDLVAYEEATRGRAPYLTLLRNRLQKLEELAVASSPLAPRGA